MISVHTTDGLCSDTPTSNLYNYESGKSYLSGSVGLSRKKLAYAIVTDQKFDLLFRMCANNKDYRTRTASMLG